MRRRSLIPQRKRVFLGCEGESEQSYGVLLNQIIETVRPGFYIHSILLQPGGGDPLAIIELARKRILQEERKRETPYIVRAVLLDSDKRGQVPERDALAINIAAEAGIHLIWQESCHEAFLLRHLDGCQTLRPPTTDLAMQELKRRWPEYYKGLPALRLASRITKNEIKKAIPFESGLAEFLEKLGYV